MRARSRARCCAFAAKACRRCAAAPGAQLLVTLKVEVPKRLNEKQRQALKAFDEAMGGKAGGGKKRKWFD